MALPGVSTILKDRFFTLARTDVPAGPRVVAIAPRASTHPDGTHDVASLDPYSPRSEEDAIAAFGEGSGAHRAYIEIIAGGGLRPIIVALDASATLDTTVGGHVDKAFDAAETAEPAIIVAWGRGGHPLDWEIPATPGNDAPLGIYADNSASPTTSWAKFVADKCKAISDRSNPVFGVLGLKPYIGTGSKATENIIASDYATYIEVPNLIDRTATSFGDNGGYLSVVGAEIRPVTYQESYGYSNSACIYAGYLSSLLANSAPTAKPILNVVALRSNTTRPQQQLLIDKGVVPVGLNFRRVPTWIDGITFAKPSSDYARLSTLRIAFDAVTGVRGAAIGFIGEPANLQNRSAFETAITKVLRNMTVVGALNGSDFTVTYVPRENKALVDLILRPAFELRNIEISVTVDL